MCSCACSIRTRLCHSTPPIVMLGVATGALWFWSASGRGSFLRSFLSFFVRSFTRSVRCSFTCLAFAFSSTFTFTFTFTFRGSTGRSVLCCVARTSRSAPLSHRRRKGVQDLSRRFASPRWVCLPSALVLVLVPVLHLHLHHHPLPLSYRGQTGFRFASFWWPLLPFRTLSFLWILCVPFGAVPSIPINPRSIDAGRGRCGWVKGGMVGD